MGYCRELHASMNRLKAHLARLMMFIAVGYLAAGVCAQEAIQNPDDDLPSLKPTNTIEFPLIDFIYPVKTRSDSSDSVVAFTSTVSINIWSLAVYYWPEAIGVVNLIVLLSCVWRLLRNKMIVGQPHCRKCHYSLIAFEGDTCPECGVNLSDRNRIIGRRFGWRIGICLVVSIFVVVGYLPGRNHVPRQGWFADHYQILSPRLYRWMMNRKTLQRDHHEYLQRFVEIDVTTGKLIRQYKTKSGREIHTEFSPDGNAAVLRHGRMIQLFDLRSGQCLADMDMVEHAGEFLNNDESRIARMTLGEKPEILYLCTWDGSLQIWNLVDGSVEELAKLDDMPSEMFVIPDENRLGMLFSETSNGWAWREFDLQSRQFVNTIRSLNGRNIHELIPSSDGSRITLIEKGGELIEILNRQTGELINAIDPPGASISQISIMATSVDNRWILAGAGNSSGMLTSGSQLYVFDSASGICLGRLDVPNLRMVDVAILPDNKTVVIIGRIMPMTKAQSKMLVYDLSQLTAD